MDLFGELAWKNIKREKKKYRTIEISLTISIIIFFISTGFVKNLFSKTDELLNNYQNFQYDYKISGVNQYETKSIISYLNKNNLINNYVIYRSRINGKAI